ncbi:winged helix-turn-helix domain-containing protein [Stackebrandtia nassauensis]|uniref:Transcriptional regulator, ArsR family n=1 Tax=Stackebrandtia nassauensis (strain DSM 44728 / CIP 108903 / NRRL B-16338 / NBRC 102104 / LLR-40K-21) TaxID=446470 RepID=D3PV94_STANL|nr:helix-turn-helix domain-containing protein [Stackebrandtia nassauensis]ADD41147.1 transcriptional regulator, ArsR family [Stackebrandtia nassauensis DSM 44728]
MTEKKTRHVTDAETLKAVTHPLRVKLLGTLRVLGPATASELGRRFGESSGSTSYHLRILAKYGFIEEDPEQPNARDKRWRSVHWGTSWSNAELQQDPAGAEAARAMRRRQLELLIESSERYEADIDSWGPVWQEAAGLSDHFARMKATTVNELRERVHALVREYAERDRDTKGTEMVQVYLGTFPLDESQIQ